MEFFFYFGVDFVEAGYLFIDDLSFCLEVAILPMPFLEVRLKRLNKGFKHRFELSRNIACLGDVIPIYSLILLHELEIFLQICCLFRSELNYHLKFDCVRFFRLALELLHLLSKPGYFRRVRLFSVI